MPHQAPLIISANEQLNEAVKVLRAGGIIAYPTETFYGLAVDAANPLALKRLIDLKGRPEGKAIPLIAGDLITLKSMIRGEIPPAGKKLIKAFWPGPLTLIFHASDAVNPLITGGSKTIGLRISDYPLCKRLLQAFGAPITSTSANPAGRPPARDAAEVKKYFASPIDLIIDGGRTQGGLASTVVDVRGDKPVILREGLLKAAYILKAAE